MCIIVLCRDDVTLAAGQTDTLFRGHQTHGIGCVLQLERPRHDEKDVHHTITREGDTFTGRVGCGCETAIARIADAAKGRRKGRTTTTIRRTILLQCRLHKLRFGLIIHKRMNDFFNRTKIQKKQQSQTPGWHSAKKLPARRAGSAYHLPHGRRQGLSGQWQRGVQARPSCRKMAYL